MKALHSDLPLARFFFKDDDIRSNGLPKPGMFKPKKGDALSVFDIEDMDHPAVCGHGHKHANNPKTGRIHKGYVSLNYSTYQELDLDGVYDNDPPRHVSIEFPLADEKRREIAKAIAGEADKSRVQKC